MNLICWNCRGLGNPRAIHFLKDLVSSKKPLFVFLSETLCISQKIGSICSLLGFDDFFVVDAQGHSGGLAFFWKVSAEGKVLSHSQNHIDLEVSIQNLPRFRLTGFYGEPNRALRYQSWNLLSSLATVLAIPWCVFGDFNNTLAFQDKRGGLPYPDWLISGFQEVVSRCQLVDLDLIGHPFTWEKGRGSSGWMEVRLDRALVSYSWLSAFPQAKLFNLPFSASDHSPLLLSLCSEVRFSSVSRFRFENAWVREPLCRQLILEQWSSVQAVSIQDKLHGCRHFLSKWGVSVTGRFKSRIGRCKAMMRKFKGRQEQEAVKQYEDANNEMFEILQQKEIYWQQRAKQTWLQAGDQNTKFFHSWASKRRKRNSFSALKDLHGNWVSWGCGLEQHIQSYFTEMYSASAFSGEAVLRCVEAGISSDMNEQLLAPVEESEVKSALFQMHPSKSPGPDGFNPSFYQSFWDIVRKEVTQFVQEFFSSGVFPSHFNSTLLVLIPKVPLPDCLGEMRPIALCNVIYKVISKVLANRLKLVLPAVISENQCAFLPGRLISDNILISFELMHYLKRKTRGSRGGMAIKLDMSKAYDRVEWGFLKAMLLKMGFHDRWVRLLMFCVSSVSYSVVAGGHEIGPIIPQRGLRQGDPLSPYLYLIVAEGLSALIRCFEEVQLIHGLKVSRLAPMISHMFFAYDCYLFCRASEGEGSAINSLLEQFQRATGQQINCQKSTIYFSRNTRRQVCDSLCSILSIP